MEFKISSTIPHISALILFARHPINFSAELSGFTIDVCAATPATCPIFGFCVAAVTFDSTSEYKFFNPVCANGVISS